MKTHEYLEELVSQDVYIDNPYLHKQEEEGIIFIMKVFTYGFVILIILICVANIFNTISTGIALRRREYAMLKSVGMTPKGFNKMIHRSEEHTSELQSRGHLVCRLLLENRNF